MPREEMLAYIRAETAAGRTYGAIAKALGVTRNVVAGLCARNAIRGPNAAFHKGGRTAASPRCVTLRSSAPPSGWRSAAS